MQNGITRLYNAIWYQQIGRALEQKDIEKENTEVTLDTFEEKFDNYREDIQTRKQSNNLLNKSEVLSDPSVNSKISDLVAQRILTENVDAVRQTYEDIINDKKENIQRYKQVIGQLIAIVEMKKNSLSSITEEINKLEEMKEASASKAQAISLELKLSGLSDREIEQHPDYTKCMKRYNDLDSTVKEKNVRTDELERDIKRAQQDIDHHKSNITHLHRDVEKIKTEQSEAISDLITAREKEEINAILTDINVD